MHILTLAPNHTDIKYDELETREKLPRIAVGIDVVSWDKERTDKFFVLAANVSKTRLTLFSYTSLHLCPWSPLRAETSHQRTGAPSLAIVQFVVQWS